MINCDISATRCYFYQQHHTFSYPPPQHLNIRLSHVGNERIHRFVFFSILLHINNRQVEWRGRAYEEKKYLEKFLTKAKRRKRKKCEIDRNLQTLPFTRNIAVDLNWKWNKTLILLQFTIYLSSHASPTVSMCSRSQCGVCDVRFYSSSQLLPLPLPLLMLFSFWPVFVGIFYAWKTETNMHNTDVT